MNTKQLNILLADDDPDDCYLFKEALRELAGYTNLTAVHDGEQLMELLINEKNSKPDVIFMDINMPRKNGFECLAEIKQKEKLKDLPVVILSTSFEYDKISDLFETGADIYVRKPNNFSQLVEVIHHALEMTAEDMPKGKLKFILNA